MFPDMRKYNARAGNARKERIWLLAAKPKKNAAKNKYAVLLFSSNLSKKI
jgi:hypothetical protein